MHWTTKALQEQPAPSVCNHHVTQAKWKLNDPLFAMACYLHRPRHPKSTQRQTPPRSPLLHATYSPFEARLSMKSCHLQRRRVERDTPDLRWIASKLRKTDLSLSSPTLMTAFPRLTRAPTTHFMASPVPLFVSQQSVQASEERLLSRAKKKRRQCQKLSNVKMAWFTYCE